MLMEGISNSQFVNSEFIHYTTYINYYYLHQIVFQLYII